MLPKKLEAIHTQKLCS